MRGAATGSTLLTLLAAAVLFWPLPEPPEKAPERTTTAADQTARQAAKRARQATNAAPDAPAPVTLPAPPPPKPSKASESAGTSESQRKTPSEPSKKSANKASTSAVNAEPAPSAKPEPAPEPEQRVAALKPTSTPEPEPELTSEPKPETIPALEPSANSAPTTPERGPTPKPPPRRKTPEPRVDPLTPQTGDSTPSSNTASASDANKPGRTPETETPELTSAPANGVSTERIRVDAGNRSANAHGGALLRMMEHGSGPDITIAWPSAASARSALYDELAGCLGMTTAVVGRNRKLFRAATSPGQPWVPNRDRYSGFMRQPQGYLAPDERQKANRIRARHNLSGSAPAVRLFPRAVDAALLGGLRRAIGPSYRDAKRITGRYRLDGGQVVITELRADGAAVSGRIVFDGGCPGRGA